MKLRFASLLLLVVCAIAAMPAMASVVYTNGPINGTINAWNICCGYQVSDSFTVSSATTITGFDAGFWVGHGDTPLSLDWSIGTSFFGSDVASGTATLSNTLFCSSCGYQGLYDIYTSTVSGLNVAIGTGTYYLTLQNGVTAFASNLFWDQNNGPSSAMQNTTGQIGSEAFTIYGGGSGVPEPSTLAMMGSGVLGMVGLLRRKLNV